MKQNHQQFSVPDKFVKMMRVFLCYYVKARVFSLHVDLLKLWFIKDSL